MAYSIETVPSGSAETQRRNDASPRRRRLYELIVSGFEHLLSQQGHTRIDGRGSGYVVWVPRREQYRQQVLDGESEGEEGDDGSPLVLYGGGYDGLFSGGLEQALGCCDCLSPPLRWVRIPLELLPPPAHSPPRTSSAKQATARSSGKPPESAEQYSSSPSSAPRGQHQEKKKKKYGFVGVTPEPDGGWGAARTRPGARGRNLGDGARNAGLGRDGGCKREGGAEDDDTPRKRGVGAGNRIAREGDAGKWVREREMVDLWWLTDPPAPKVSAEALRLRVATETVHSLRTDAEEAPDVVCTIEVCQGRPYVPGRLQRYPNVATSTGPYRAVHSYRVLSSGPRPAEGGLSPGEGGSTAGLGGPLFCAPRPGASSSRRRSGGVRDAEGLAWVSVTDVKPSHWYNVRHRFTWRVGGRSSLEGVEEVVTATRHVHTEAFFPPVTAPPRPYAILGCLRRQQQQQKQQQQPGDRRSSREHGGWREGGGLVFHFRLRWGPGVRGAGRNEGRGFGQGGAPQEIEYILQESMIQPRGSIIGDTASAKKAGPSSPTSGGGGPETGLGGPSSSSNLLRSTGASSPKPQATTTEELQAPSGNNSAAARHNATWSPGGQGGRGTTTAADDEEEGEDPFSEQLFGDGGSQLESTGYVESSWGAWRTVLRTRKTRETVELPHTPVASSSPPLPSTKLELSREGGGVAVGLRYRVGARRRDGPQKAVFSEVLEVPTALLARLYDIEEISTTRRPLPSPTPASKKRTAGGARPEPSALAARREGGGRAGGLEDEEAEDFLRAFELSEDEDDSFPTRVAWELHSEFWSQQTVAENVKSSLEEEKEARVRAEAESIQRTLAFPVNTKFIEGVIREIDATAGG